MVYILIAILIFLGCFAIAWAICAVGARADEKIEEALQEESNVL